MELISPADLIFLIGESREHPMHVGGLALYDPPEGAGPEFVRELFDRSRHRHGLPADVPQTPGDDSRRYRQHRLDLSTRTSTSTITCGAPRCRTPGRVRDLLEMTSRMHGTLLDRHRPLWEAHLIEGLPDGRFAVYTKIHHSLIDGVSALKLTERTLSKDPDDTEVRVPWTLPPKKREKRANVPAQHRRAWVGCCDRYDAAGSVVGLGPSTMQAGARGADRATADPAVRGAQDHVQRQDRWRPPGGRRSPGRWNGSSGSSRPPEVTINDVVLAMCAGALRAYLLEQNALPDAPLIAMVPVSLRSEAEADAGGNMVGVDPVQPGHRYRGSGEAAGRSSRDSMRGNKKVFA